jgi:hypothetical protein
MAGAQAGAGEPTEEEIRAAYEAELSRITAVDMIAQTTVSLLNLGARRLAPEQDEQSGSQAPGGPGGPQRDLEQARDAIDGARALLEILQRRIPQELGPLRDALSRLQMAYARETPAAPASSPEQPAGTGAPPVAGAPSQPQSEQQPPGPGPAESSGRLWVPGR